MEELSDQEIIEQFAVEANRNYVFNLLVRQYQQRLYWHIRRMVIDHDDSDDILQNVFIKAFHALPKFRGDSKIYTWLYTNGILGSPSKFKKLGI